MVYLFNRYAECINATFRKNFLVQFVVSGISISTSIFELSDSSKEISKLVACFIYTTALLVELFLYCYYAEKISQEVNQY